MANAKKYLSDSEYTDTLATLAQSIQSATNKMELIQTVADASDKMSQKQLVELYKLCDNSKGVHSEMICQLLQIRHPLTAMKAKRDPRCSAT